MSFNLPPLFKRKPKATVQLRVPAMTFICEQDGPVERELKAAWMALLAARGEIRRAYLARASYSEVSEQHVVLALCSNKSADASIVEALRGPFAERFGRNAQLDMLFVNDAQEKQIAKVSSPFYAAV